MAIQTIATLKSYFNTGDIPTEAQFIDVFDTLFAQSPLTTKGDIVTYSTLNARLAVGTNGQVLTADSAEATGLKWATPASSGITINSTAITSGTAGRILFENASNQVSEAAGLTYSSGLFTVLGTTQQAKFAYDASNHLGITIGSAGSASINAQGTNPNYILNLNGTQTATITSSAITLGQGSSYTFTSFASNSLMTMATNNGRRYDFAGAGVHGNPISLSQTFQPTTGATQLNALYINPTINETGSASGGYIGLRINVVETAVLGTSKLFADFQIGGTSKLSIDSTGNFVLNTSAGSKIGTATSQKLGFWNKTPVIQPTNLGASATVSHIGGTAMLENDTIGGYTLAQVVQALQTIGILA